MRRRLFTIPLIICLLLLPAFGAFAEVRVDLAREEYGESFVAYPVISGMANAFVQDSANAAIRSAVQPHLDTLALLRSGAPGTVKATAAYELLPSSDGHDVLSVLIEHSGRLPGGRTGHGYIPLMLDLANGQPVPAQALFGDMGKARDALDHLGEQALEEALSNYLDIYDFLPVPMESVRADGEGLTFFYPAGGPVWLSGRAASVRFLWHELEGALDVGEGSLLRGLGIPEKLAPAPETPERVREAVESGMLPGLDVRLGDSVGMLEERYGLLFDPEGFPGGTAYYLEDDRFRETALVSRDEEQVSGILAARLNLFGLITGRTAREEVRQVLGEPDAAYPLDASEARAYGLAAGETDTYRYGTNELRMHYDEAGVLSAVWLSAAE
ncbi:MAG TPA: hypothetical protein VLA21_10265 [Candidatus Limnocylindria bacterium]|nr:hypothetical protein [Candidatus Limnocylindria bacterium]